MILTAYLILAVTLTAWAVLFHRMPRLGKVGLRARLRALLAVLRAEPETGALTLAQAALLSTDDFQRGVLETLVIESTLLDRLPFMAVVGNSFKYNEEATLPGVEFRAVNAAYSESTGTVVQRTESIVDLGGDADVDLFIEKTRSNLNGQRAIQTRMKTKSAAAKYNDTFVNGDVAVDANSFDGLKKRLTGAQVIDAATNGMGPVAGGQDFFDALDSLIAAVPGGPDAFYMNNLVRPRILSSGRRLGGTEWIQQLFFEESGAPIRKPIPTYAGIPMLDIGNKADGTRIIPQTETQGTSTVSSSIYAVKFGQDEGDQAVTGLQNGDLDVRDLGEQQVKPVYRTRVQWFTGLAVFGRGAARLRGVLNA